MHVEFLVEEPSAEVALKCLLPSMLAEACTFEVRVHQGKPALLRNLPNRLRAYRAWHDKQLRVVVLVDCDKQDCLKLKERLEQSAKDAGLSTRSCRHSDDTFRVLNRIAVEELEAWFLGDVEALRAAFPRVPGTLGKKKGLRDPDAVRGGTAEALFRVLRSAGYFARHRRMPKTLVAAQVAPHMDPSRNRSKSFRVFCEGIRELTR